MFGQVEINIDKNDVCHGDILGMHGDAKRFVKLLVNNNICHAIFGINSAYGTGKSTYIEICKQIILKRKKELPIIIDVVDYQDSSEPIKMILEGILAASFPDKSKERKIQEKVVKVMSALTMSVVNQANIAGEVFQSLLDNKSENVGNKKLAQVAEEFILKTLGTPSIKRSFKKEIEKIDNRIIVFLDNFDRCDIDFAIKILEDLRRFMNSNNMTFVIAFSRVQVEEFVTRRFGYISDIDNYFRKYFDYIHMMPSYKINSFIHESIEKSTFFISNVEEKGSIKKKIYEIIDIFQSFKILFQERSLRNIQHCIFRLAIALSSPDKPNKYNPNLTAFLLTLRSDQWKLYEQLIKRKLSGLELLLILSKEKDYETTLQNESIFSSLASNIAPNITIINNSTSEYITNYLKNIILRELMESEQLIRKPSSYIQDFKFEEYAQIFATEKIIEYNVELEDGSKKIKILSLNNLILEKKAKAIITSIHSFSNEDINKYENDNKELLKHIYFIENMHTMEIN